jgi:hypothetical protein
MPAIAGAIEWRRASRPVRRQGVSPPNQSWSTIALDARTPTFDCVRATLRRHFVMGLPLSIVARSDHRTKLVLESASPDDARANCSIALIRSWFQPRYLRRRCAAISTPARVAASNAAATRSFGRAASVANRAETAARPPRSGPASSAADGCGDGPRPHRTAPPPPGWAGRRPPGMCRGRVVRA